MLMVYDTHLEVAVAIKHGGEHMLVGGIIANAKDKLRETSVDLSDPSQHLSYSHTFMDPALHNLDQALFMDHRNRVVAQRLFKFLLKVLRLHLPPFRISVPKVP